MPKRGRRSSGLSNRKGSGKRKLEHPSDERSRWSQALRAKKKKVAKKARSPRTPIVAPPTQADQRTAAYTCYVLALGCPPPERWNGVLTQGGTFAEIKRRTGVSRKVSEPVLKQLWASAEKTSEEVSQHVRRSGRTGAKRAKIKPGTPQSDAVVGALTSNWGERWTATMMDVHRTTIGRTRQRFQGKLTKRQ